MEINFIEIDGKRIQLPVPQELEGDSNQDAVSRMSEMIEQIEKDDATCIVLGTSASFVTE